MSRTRRLAAILAADVAGYSRLMGADEEGTLERLKALRRELLDPKIAEHRLSVQERFTFESARPCTVLYAPHRDFYESQTGSRYRNIPIWIRTNLLLMLNSKSKQRSN
jgi:hypothetical protein